MSETEGSTTDAATAEVETATSTPDTTTGTETTDTEVDWKAKSREWEKRAKANSAAAAELEKLRKQGMSETEKAVSEAATKAKAEAAIEFGKRLAAAELKAAVAAKGLDIGDALDLIDSSRFVGEDGEVDASAIKSAVAKLAKLAPKPSTSGADFSGSSGTGAPITEAQLAQMSPEQIAKAHAEGRLKHLL